MDGSSGVSADGALVVSVTADLPNTMLLGVGISAVRINALASIDVDTFKCKLAA